MSLTLKQRNQTSLDPKQVQARSLIVPGVTLYGYCCGYFGRDSYGDKLVLEVYHDSIVVQEENGCQNSANDIDWVSLVESSNRSLQDEEDYNNTPTR